MRMLRAVGRFLYTLVIGDDWRLPAGVAACLAVAACFLLTTSIPAGPVAVMCGAAMGLWFFTCLLWDARRPRRRQ